MEDLERLADQEYWDEVIAHLDDIKALDRDDRWQTVLETSVVGWMESLVNKDDTENAYLDSTDVFNRFKTLKKSDEAMKLKEKVGMRQVEACLRFQDPETKRLKDCRPISKEFIGYHKGRKAELAVKVANLTSYQRNARWAAQYYQMALEAKNGHDVVCADDRLPVVIHSGLYGMDEEKKVADDLWKTCPEHLKKYTLERIDKLSVNNVSLGGYCKALKNHGDNPPEKCGKAKW
jgi:hypothetical protein